MAARRQAARAVCLGLVFCALTTSARAQTVDVPQDWTARQKVFWYTATQGSRLLPLSWLRALEQPGQTTLFLDRAHIEKFRYLPAASAAPGRLPVGFAIDTQPDTQFEITRLRWKKPQGAREAWVGMTCSACHSNEITFQGKRLRVEGAPTIADFQGFMETLNRALIETRDDDAKFNRFAAAVLKGVDSAGNRTMLKDALGRLIDWQRKVEDANATPLRYGFARLDAFGHIFNKVKLRAKGDPAPKNPSDAPVSYPFLWNIHQQNKVQWNGIADSVPLSATFDFGALGRNVGEVVGVFAELELIRPVLAAGGYPSSVNIGNLVKLEAQIAKLLPPAWPDVFPPIDPARWEAGKALFNREPGGCRSCHAVLERIDRTTKVEVEMTRLIGEDAIGTDPWMACNAYTYQADSGVLHGTSKKFFPSLPLIRSMAPVAEMLGTTVAGVLWNRRHDVVDNLSISTEAVKERVAAMNLFDPRKGPAVITPGELFRVLVRPVESSERADRLKRCLTEASPVLAYKGRPLTGVWATPPFLHNGSVATLFDLMLPPADRPRTFALGTREFDPERVGFVNEASSTPWKTEQAARENTFVFETHDGFGQPIPGNDNGGHDYGNARFSDEERWALVEYMKAVGGKRVGDRIVP